MKTYIKLIDVFGRPLGNLELIDTNLNRLAGRVDARTVRKA